MSTVAMERVPALAAHAGDRVDADSGSVRAALDARIPELPKRDEQIVIALGEGPELILDLAAGTVKASQGAAGEPAATLMVAPRHLARIMNGSLEPRSALLGGQMKFKGRVETAVRLLDELAGKRFARTENFTDLALPSPTTDLRLARYFGMSEGFFLGLQADYDLMQRKREIAAELEAIQPRAA